MSPRLALAVSLVSATLACAVQGSLGKDSSETGTAGSSSSASEESTSATSTSDAAGTSADASTGPHGSGSSDGGATTHGSETGPGACDPAMRDDACTTCMKSSCCAAVSDCGADPVCTCIHTCHGAGTPLPDCVTMCGDDGGLEAALEQCVQDHCTPPCP